VRKRSFRLTLKLRSQTLECGSEASALTLKLRFRTPRVGRAAPLSHIVGEGLGVRAEKRVRPTAHSPLARRAGEGDKGGEGLVHIHAIDVQPIRADSAVQHEQVLRLRAAAEVEQHGQQVGVVHNAVAVDIHRRVAGAEREQNRQ
jgi:hypothetical protein